jgi:ubiquinone biosynthesis protein
MSEDLYSLGAADPLPRKRRYGKPIVVTWKREGRYYSQMKDGGASASASRPPNPPIRKVKLRRVEEIHALSESSGESFRINRAASNIYRTLPTSFRQTNWRRLEILAAAIYYFTASLWLWLVDLILVRVTSVEQRNLPDERNLKQQRNLQRKQTLKNQRNSKNAKRLRHIVESLGGGFIKVGQQFALRSDLLPPEFCDELDQLYDNTKPFPVEQAKEAIKRQAGGREIHEIFLSFKDEPIGSASLACVYHAVLKNGDHVAVKVRRPGIESLFAADIAALASVAWILELLTIYRQNFFQNVLAELRNIALEETDFQLEARYQELFRKYHNQRKGLRVTAPRVYFEYSGEDVLVSEFVTGIKLTEILDHIERGDKAYLEMLANLYIRPSTIAKRLIRSKYYSFHECPFFHGDPHPGNVVVQPHNRIVMLDFGACGVFSERDRRLMLRMNELYVRGDVSGMVDCVLGLLEPLPLADVDSFKKELLEEWWKGYYGLQSDHAEWWERTSLRLWMALLKLFGKYQISMPANMIRMVRATLLYDTVAAQLYPKINVFVEFAAYSRSAALAARQEFVDCAIRQVFEGPNPVFFLRLRQLSQMGRDLFFRIQQFLGTPEFSFVAVMDKIYFAIDAFVNLVKVTGMVAMVTAVAFATGRIFGFFHAEGWRFEQWHTSLRILIGIAAAVLALNVFAFVRRTMTRWREKDNYSDRIGVTV